MERLFDPPEERSRAAGRATGRWRRACARATLDEFVGQEHLLGEGSALRTALESGAPHSMVLYGPPGHRQDDARAARRRARRAPRSRSSRAVNAGPRRGARGDRARRASAGAAAAATIFFLDEIHRFNKAQQDALLPAVEEGLVTLIGATTENPYFEVNSALLSRAQVYELQRARRADDVEALLRRALERGERGEGVEVARRGDRRSSPRAPAATPAPR